MPELGKTEQTRILKKCGESGRTMGEFPILINYPAEHVMEHDHVCIDHVILRWVHGWWRIL